MAKKYTLIIDNCANCPNHIVFNDPDPYDSFCSDDMGVKCKVMDRNITVGCRPYNLRKECTIPTWCPLENE